jgi:hypothetical protein
MKRRLGLGVGAATVVWLISGSLSNGLLGNELLAPPDAGKYAVTDPAQVDDDYAYQGEYAGSVCDPQCGWIWTGLQVIARGDGRFEAVQYRGGLPGAGWDRQTKRMLAGQLSEGLLVLNAEDGWSVVADGRTASVSSSDGRLRGSLTKRHRASPTLGAAPPRNALVLFDGTSADQFQGGKVTEDGLLDVGGVTKMPVRDFRLHLEFRLPYMPYATGQGRSNSGVYIQQRYEVQILDSFGLEGVANECGGLYRQQAPDVNMCLPPLVWQTYDIWFTAARFDDEGNKIANARLTLLHNGVAIHNRREIPAKTGAGKPEGSEWLPILLQNHSNPVRFRNIWIVLEPEAEKAAPCRTPTRCQPLRRLLRRLPCGRR